MEPISYRKAEKKDIDTLIDLRIQFTTILTGIDSKERVEALTGHLRNYFREVFDGTETCAWYIAWAGNKAVGTGGLTYRQHPGNFKNPSGRSAYIMNMYTLPEFRRKGICSAILNALVAEGREKGVTAFELHATLEGEYVYKQLGFKIHDEPTYRKYI